MSPTMLAHRQHANIRADLFMDGPGFDTPATRFCQAVARRLDRHEWAFFNLAVYWSLMLVASCLSRDPNGIRLPDRAQPGHVFLIFANGDGEGCACGGIVVLDEIDAARDAAINLTARDRRHRLLDLTKTARARRLQMGDPSSRHLAIECAGLLLDNEDSERLEHVQDALPAFVILTGREPGRPIVRTRTICTTLPGAWLGMRAPAGRA